MGCGDFLITFTIFSTAVMHQGTDFPPPMVETSHHPPQVGRFAVSPHIHTHYDDYYLYKSNIDMWRKE
jgi:hypothetical protein